MATDAGADVDDEDQGDAGNDPADEPGPRRPSSTPAFVDDGAGWVLGLILWAGVVLPYLKKGPSGVKAWWMAKFFNKALDGSELP